MRKYFDIFKFSLKTEFNFKIDYFFSLFAFVVHIFVLNELWDYILQGKQVNGLGRSELVWYITIGEFIMYSISKKNYKRVSELIKSGNIANLLVKPVNIIKYIFAEECTCIINIGVNFVLAIILGTLMAGVLHVTFIQIILFLLSLVLELLIAMLLQVFVGLLAFITEENESFYLLVSKALLLLVFTPLNFFPNYIQNILKLLPTTYAIYPAGKILVDFNFNNAICLIFLQLLALSFMFILINILNKKGVRKINVNGG